MDAPLFTQWVGTNLFKPDRIWTVSFFCEHSQGLCFHLEEITRMSHQEGPEAKSKYRPFLLVLALVVLGGGAWVSAGDTPKAQLHQCKVNIKNLGTAQEQYSMDHDGDYTQSLESLVPKYLPALPNCPTSGEMSYKAYVGPEAPRNVNKFEQYNYLECQGDHSKAGITGKLGHPSVPDAPMSDSIPEF